MSSGLARLGKRLAPRADGTPGAVQAGVLLGRQGTVEDIDAAAGVVLVFMPEDDEATPMGWVGPQPRVGDVVLWATINGSPWCLGVRQPDPWPVVLGEAGAGNTTGTTPSGVAATVLSLTVSIPVDLPAGSTVKVEGDVFMAPPGGVGSIVSLTGGVSKSRTNNSSSAWDGHVAAYDVDPPAGPSRTYNLVVTPTAAGAVAWRAPLLRAELIVPGRG